MDRPRCVLLAPRLNVPPFHCFRLSQLVLGAFTGSQKGVCARGHGH